MSATVEPTTTRQPAAPKRSSADQFMRRLLRLPEGRTSTAAEARSAFQKSLAFTTCRCLLMYIVLPFVLPAVGIARGVGPVIGIVIGIVAIFSIVYSIRRFWRADHSKRWHYTVFGGAIIVVLVYLTITDTFDLFD
ncbi:MAG: hypothetical protein HKN44_16090 [Ilumatobacter sp.]|nr:hypothetical protein [Ilumatobacter sp.]